MTETGDPLAAAAAVVRRHGAVLGVPSEGGEAPNSGLAPMLADIVAGLDAVPLLRIVGGPGAGRARLAAALEAVFEVRCEVVDANAPLPRTVPDVELFAWCTAPCRHEVRWLRRPRRHPAIVVVTRADTWSGGERPEWAEGLVAVGEPAPGRPGFDRLRGLVGEALSDVPALRLALATLRLDRDCDALGVRDRAESLCAELSGLDTSSSPSRQVAS